MNLYEELQEEKNVLMKMKAGHMHLVCQNRFVSEVPM